MKPRGAIATGLLAMALAGCGPTPPQAPLGQAKKLDAATSGISTACGEAYQVTAFPGDHRRALDVLETNAVIKARKLESVFARNPAWVYQGETVGRIVRDSVAMLRQCGLVRAAGVLTEATAKR